MSPAARGWLLFAAVLIVAFLVGGIVFGAVATILHTCGGTGRCAPTEQYIELNVGAGLAVAAATAIFLLLIGGRRPTP